MPDSIPAAPYMDAYYSPRERAEVFQRHWDQHNNRKWAAIWLTLMLTAGWEMRI